jgi:hypothetical protein
MGDAFTPTVPPTPHQRLGKANAIGLKATIVGDQTSE